MPSIKTNNTSIDELTPDKKLISLVCEGSELALNELMQRYKYKLYAFISRYVKDEDAAYDILQETFIRLHFKADTYKSSYKFSTWLYQIAINLCRDWGRKQKIKQWLSLDASLGNEEIDVTYHDVIANTGDNIEDIASMRQQLCVIDQEIEKLPHKLKAALIMFALEGNSQEVCAEVLNVTIKTVETRVYRARKILAEKLAKNF